MADTTVLRLSRPQHGPDEADFVLVQVIPQGRSPLDVKLIGTESSLVFSVSCRLAGTLDHYFHALIWGLISAISEAEKYLEAESQKHDDS
jgi:hypothetical protein